MMIDNGSGLCHSQYESYPLMNLHVSKCVLWILPSLHIQEHERFQLVLTNLSMIASGALVEDECHTSCCIQRLLSGLCVRSISAELRSTWFRFTS